MIQLSNAQNCPQCNATVRRSGTGATTGCIKCLETWATINSIPLYDGEPYDSDITIEPRWRL